MKRSFRFAVSVIAIMAAILAAWLALTSVSAKDLPPLKNGDIIFQTSRSSQSSAILLASMSAYSHMGMIEIGLDGAASVVEAVGPVKSTPLDDWIKRGLGGRIAIKRLASLTPNQSKAVLQAAHHYDGLPYDLFFLSTTDQIYCSELVRLAYGESAAIEVGKNQKAKQLYLDNFAAKRLIARRWQKHPLCQSSETSTFEACYAQILEQELVTPDSIFNDPKLELIYSNYMAIP
jgi:Permuted papain-like amidase enzyme, YaeF/YiiX, C92 family